jgi:hypothetical protein
MKWKLIVGGIAIAAATHAEIVEPQRRVEGIADNSFLIEEAYNQEPGVVQHIATTSLEIPRVPDSEEYSWVFSFTQEWPVFTQKHQLSYTLPYHFTDAENNRHNGIGDVMLHYRYQALLNPDTLSAFSPRLSIALPSGDAKRGFGEDTVGYQVNLPFSTTFGDCWFLHLNAGSTFFPNAASADRRELLHYNIGASVIYAWRSDFHLLIETVGNWDESLRPSGNLRHEFSALVMPGMRKAINFQNGSQLVAGIGIPIGLNNAAPDIGAFLYLSFEHFFRESAPE